MGTSKQNVKQLVSSLEKSGILYMGDSDKDKRARNVEITEYGKEIGKKVLLRVIIS